MMVIKDSLIKPYKVNKFTEFTKQNDKFTKMLDEMSKQNDEIKRINEKLAKELKEQSKMFKKFDLDFITNQIIFGNANDTKRDELFKKRLKIAKELSEL